MISESKELARIINNIPDSKTSAEISTVRASSYQIHPNFIVCKKKIGRGSFSSVYQGLNITNQCRVAIKKIHTNNHHAGKMEKYFQSEIEIMKSLEHPNILALYDVVYQTKYIYLILEYCEQGDLSKLMRARGRFSEQQCQSYLTQLAEGLKYLYQHNIFHRDLKPQNLLLTKEGTLKLTDFGFARIMHPDALAETMCGSPLYMAPEILHYKKYTIKSDLWSVGIILYQMLLGTTPYRAGNIPELVDQMDKTVVTIPEQFPVSKDGKNLMLSLLQKEPADRIEWRNFFYHPWFLRHPKLDQMYMTLFPQGLPLKASSQSVISPPSPLPGNTEATISANAKLVTTRSDISINSSGCLPFPFDLENSHHSILKETPHIMDDYMRSQQDRDRSYQTGESKHNSDFVLVNTIGPESTMSHLGTSPSQSSISLTSIWNKSATLAEKIKNSFQSIAKSI